MLDFRRHGRLALKLQLFSLFVFEVFTMQFLGNFAVHSRASAAGDMSRHTGYS